jgi:hypothetical protein
LERGDGMRDETTNPYKSPDAPDASEAEQPARPADRAARRALLMSFGVNGSLGGAFIYVAWMGTDLFSAGTRAAAFIVIIAGIHLIGYRLWQRQSARANSGSPPGIAQTAAEPRRLFGTLTSSVLLLVGTGFFLLLDGQVFTNSLIFLGCWGASLAIWLSRRKKPRGIGTLFVILLHMAIIGLVLLCLPENYRWQQRFNQKRMDWGQKTQPTGQRHVRE